MDTLETANEQDTASWSAVLGPVFGLVFGFWSSFPILSYDDMTCMRRMFKFNKFKKLKQQVPESQTAKLNLGMNPTSNC